MKAAIPVYDLVAEKTENELFKYSSLGELTAYDFSLPHRHNYYEIFFFSKGGGQHLVDFINYPILDNSIHFVSPGQVHVLRRSADSRGILILFTKEFFHSVSLEQELFTFPFLESSPYQTLATSATEYADIEQVVSQIKSHLHIGNKINKAILRSYLDIILLKCLQLFNDKYPARITERSSVFHNFRKMVEMQFREQRQPVYYASRLNITEKKLNNVCKENTGENVSGYIRNRVLLEAKRLLVNTDFTIKEVAVMLGYDDASYFNRVFTSETGVSAGAFRKQEKSAV